MDTSITDFIELENMRQQVANLEAALLKEEKKDKVVSSKSGGIGGERWKRRRYGHKFNLMLIINTVYIFLFNTSISVNMLN